MIIYSKQMYEKLFDEDGLKDGEQITIDCLHREMTLSNEDPKCKVLKMNRYKDYIIVVERDKVSGDTYNTRIPLSNVISIITKTDIHIHPKEPDKNNPSKSKDDTMENDDLKRDNEYLGVIISAQNKIIEKLQSRLDKLSENIK